jgi:hypothetical protein
MASAAGTVNLNIAGKRIVKILFVSAVYRSTFASLRARGVSWLMLTYGVSRPQASLFISRSLPMPSAAFSATAQVF